MPKHHPEILTELLWGGIQSFFFKALQLIHAVRTENHCPVLGLGILCYSPSSMTVAPNEGLVKPLSHQQKFLR